MQQRSPLIKDYPHLTDTERIASILNHGTIKECLIESMYWLRYMEEADGPTDNEDDPANLALHFQNRVLALLTFKPDMTEQQVIANALKRDTDTKYQQKIVFLIPEELKRLEELGDLHGFVNAYGRRMYWRVEGSRLTAS